MAGPFEIATKAAIKEILEKNVQQSKFGSFLSPAGEQGIIEEIFSLLLNSRQLKAAGDKVLAQGPTASQAKHLTKR